MKFYKCSVCGNIITKVKDSSVPVFCCGKPMAELVPGSVEASAEKHIPIYTTDSNKVYVMVGEAEHPMQPEHFIEWIAIETTAGCQIKYLTPGEKPAAGFCMGRDDTLVAVYAYCNLHGLWVKEHTEPESPAVCDLKPLDMNTDENYLVCRCNNVKFSDIVNAARDHKDMNSLLSIFDEVKNTTHCSSGCGGCYNKVLAIISEMMSGTLR
ncbi:MAG: (2Fe-2S)-binding protein [Oscillospiraceae bacterium]|nr:(2Fe-2S)-binding protein [Oscillospiraceae bacterium]